MEDPDGAGPVTGKMVAEEAVRLWCIRDVSARERGRAEREGAGQRALYLYMVQVQACFALCSVCKGDFHSMQCT